jgi:putative addiction module component (TIGR02574 family)
MTTLSEILVAAQSLPPAERIVLITTLWDEMPPEAWSPPSTAWIEEANRRSDALDRG